MIKPIGDKVAIQAIPKVLSTASGIILPADGHQSIEGIVVALGTATIGDVQLGDKVLYSKYAGFDVSHGGVDYLVIPEDEIEAVL